MIRRALFVWKGLVVSAALAAPAAAPPPQGYLQLGGPDPAEGRAILEQFRAAGPERPYFLEFVLKQLPRRGSEWTVPGRLWGSRNARGSVMRIELDPVGPGGGRRLILQNGPDAAVWLYEPARPAAAPRRIDGLEPLAPGVEISAFDLQMPFLYWPGSRLLGTERIRGRPAHLFVFSPPQHSEEGLGGVRAYLDTQYRAPVQVELLDPSGQPRTTLSLVDLKKVSEQWIPKDIDVRNEASRDKTRFSVTGAALGLDLLPELFAPATLPEAVSPPPGAQIERF